MCDSTTSDTFKLYRWLFLLLTNMVSLYQMRCAFQTRWYHYTTKKSDFSCFPSFFLKVFCFILIYIYIKTQQRSDKRKKNPFRPIISTRKQSSSSLVKSTDSIYITYKQQPARKLIKWYYYTMNDHTGDHSSERDAVWLIHVEHSPTKHLFIIIYLFFCLFCIFHLVSSSDAVWTETITSLDALFYLLLSSSNLHFSLYKMDMNHLFNTWFQSSALFFFFNYYEKHSEPRQVFCSSDQTLGGICVHPFCFSSSRPRFLSILVAFSPFHVIKTRTNIQ